MPKLTIHVNGVERRVEAGSGRMLLSALRDELDLTGAKYGCGEGQCGACTVLIDGVASRSCTVPVTFAVGKHITTIEGLEHNGRLHPVQQAFLEQGAMQCGYCTPGMILSAVALLRKNPDPKVDEIVRGMEGNICRCGTYGRVIRAIQTAAKTMRDERSASDA